MRGGNASFILRWVYRMQCAYHSSSWARSSVRVPVGWTCWQGCLLQMLAGMSFLSPDCSLHFKSKPQNLLGFSCTQPETYARINRMWPQSMMCPQKKYSWEHTHWVAAPAKARKPANEWLSGGHMASGRLCITKGWQTEASCQICPDLNFSTIATLSWELVNSPGMVKKTTQTQIPTIKTSCWLWMDSSARVRFLSERQCHGCSE